MAEEAGAVAKTEGAFEHLACSLAVPALVVPVQAVVAYTNWGDHWKRGGADKATRVMLAGLGALLGLVICKVMSVYLCKTAATKK